MTFGQKNDRSFNKCPRYLQVTGGGTSPVGIFDDDDVDGVGNDAACRHSLGTKVCSVPGGAFLPRAHFWHLYPMKKALSPELLPMNFFTSLIMERHS